MTTTRMNNDDRKAIVSAIISRKFNPLEEANAKREEELFDLLYSHIYSTDLVQAMQNVSRLAGGGAFTTRNSLNVSICGKSYTLRGKRTVMVVEKHEYGSLEHFGSVDADPAKSIVDWADAREHLKTQRRVEEAELSALVQGFRTFEALSKAWPEADAFIAPVWRAKSGVSTSIAISFRDACLKFDLPPEQESA